MQTDDSPEVRKVVATLQTLCSKLPAAEQYVMVHHPAFRVGKKPFVIVGMEQHEKGATLSVNLGREMQDQLLDDRRFARTPYIGQHGWVTVPNAALKRGELDVLVVDSYRRVATKTQLAQLDGAAKPATRAASKQEPTKPRPSKAR